MTKIVTCLRVPGIAILLVLSVEVPAFGWGMNGHRIVAQIGEDHLSEAAAEQVNRITGGRSLAQIANWPDFVRSEPSWDCAKPWHYLTVEDGQPFEEALQKKGDFRGCKVPSGIVLPQNIVEAIDFFTAVLAGDPDKRAAFVKLAEANGAKFYADSVELSALSFLVHLVGDIHQPLHVGRGGDLGGNKVAVNWFGEASNLHSVWDTELVDGQNLSYTEFAAFLEAEGGNVDLGDPIDAVAWAKESNGLRFQVYEIYAYTSRDNQLPDLSYQYAHDQIRLVQDGLYRGGRRLASRLVSIF